MNCPEPESSLFLNDLPGISLKVAANVATPAQQTGAQLMRQAIDVSTRRVFNEFAGRMGGLFDFNAVVETRKINDFSETHILPAANADSGAVFKRWRSEIARLYVEEIYVKADSSGVATVKIIDGPTTKEYTVDLVANQVVTVPVRYTASAETIKITMNRATFGVYTCNSQIPQVQDCGLCGGARGHSIYATGWDGTREVTTCFGVGALVSVRCVEEIIICSLLPRMHFLLWYAAGAEFMRYRMSTPRLNDIALFSAEQAKDLEAEYRDNYETEWKNFIRSSHNYMRQLKGECFNCSGNVYTQATP